MPSKYDDRDFGVYNFIFSIKGIGVEGSAVKAWFSEISGLDSDFVPVDYREGGDYSTKLRMAGSEKFQTICLKRGITFHIELWNWIVSATGGQFKKVNGHIILLDENRKELMRWNLVNAWPLNCSGPGFKEKANLIAIETLEICYESIVGP
jgi:phage tail-like protein